MISFTDVLITVFCLLLLAIPGFIFAKAKILPASASEVLSILVLYGCQPVLIITSFQSCEFSPSIGVNMLMVAGVAAAIHILFFAVTELVFKRRADDGKIRLVKFASVFSNCGFMGIPFLQSLFTGSVRAEIIIYSAVIIAVFQVMSWTFGVYILTRDKREISVKKILLNPAIISIFIGLIMFFVIRKPLSALAPEGTMADKILEKLNRSLNYISDMSTPLPMIIIGMRLANVDLKGLFLNKWAYVSACFKLLIMPLTVIFIVWYLPVPSTVKYTVFFLLAMPSATNSVMMAVKYGQDGDFGSVCVLLSTILCVLTVPPLYLFMNGVLSIPL